jgi:hypothetical protein
MINLMMEDVVEEALSNGSGLAWGFGDDKLLNDSVVLDVAKKQSGSNVGPVLLMDGVGGKG